MFPRTHRQTRLVAAGVLALGLSVGALVAAEAAGALPAFPRPLADYAAAESPGLMATLLGRVRAEPFNAVATAVFVLAVLHTFLCGKIRHWAHVVEARHCARLKLQSRSSERDEDGAPDEVSFGGQVLHFFGEVEAVFGLWAVVLGATVVWFKGLDAAIHYIADTVKIGRRRVGKECW